MNREKIGRGLIVTAVIVIAIWLTYSYVLNTPGNRMSGRYDVYRYYGPMNFFMDHTIHEDEFPLWNPLVFCGMPHAGNPQSFAFYPPNLLRSLFTFGPTPYKTHVGFVIMMGLHLVLVTLGMYALARSHKLSVGGALAAAIAFGFSALMVRRVCEYHYITEIGWLPLQMLFLKRAMDATTIRDKLRSAVLTGLLFGVSILSGYLQIVIYMGVTLFGYALMYRLTGAGTRRVDGGRRTWRMLGTDMAVLAVVAVLGTLIACVVLVPAAELASFTARQGTASVGLYNDLRKWPISKFYQSLIVYPGMRYESETLRGSGIVALLLSLAGLTSARKRLVAVFAVLYLALLDCSLGPPFPLASLLDRIMPFTPSAYSRAYDFALLPLSMLAGLGVDALAKPMPSRRADLLRSAGLVLAGGSAIFALSKYISPHPYLHVSAWVLFAPVAALPIMVLGGRLRLGGMVRLSLPMLILFETVAWNQHYVPWLTKKRFTEPEPPPETHIVLPLDNRRGTDPIANRAMYWLRPVMNGYDPLNLRSVRDIVSGPPRDRRYHRLVTGWEPTAENYRGNLFLKRRFWLARQYVAGHIPPKTVTFPSATTVFMESGHDLPIPEVDVANLPKRSISGNAKKTPLPDMDTLKSHVNAGSSRVYNVRLNLPTTASAGRGAGPAGAVHSALYLVYTSRCPVKIETVFTDVQTGQKQFGKRYRAGPVSNGTDVAEIPLPDFPSMDATITVTLSDPVEFRFVDGYMLSDENDEDGLITISEYSANSVRLNLDDLPGPRMLTFIDADYPGWLAYLDSKETTIYKADDAFKAVVVPAGTHTVRFVFRPRSVYTGLALSIIGFGAVLTALLLCRARDRLIQV